MLQFFVIKWEVRMNRSGLFFDKKMRKTIIPGGWPGNRVQGWTSAGLVMSAATVLAEEMPPAVNAADTAWLPLSTALVRETSPLLPTSSTKYFGSVENNRPNI
jgi:hypothetical protein